MPATALDYNLKDKASPGDCAGGCGQELMSEIAYGSGCFCEQNAPAMIRLCRSCESHIYYRHACCTAL